MRMPYSSQVRHRPETRPWCRSVGGMIAGHILPLLLDFEAQEPTKQGDRNQSRITGQDFGVCRRCSNRTSFSRWPPSPGLGGDILLSLRLDSCVEAGVQGMYSMYSSPVPRREILWHRPTPPMPLAQRQDPQLPIGRLHKSRPLPCAAAAVPPRVQTACEQRCKRRLSLTPNPLFLKLGGVDRSPVANGFLQTNSSYSSMTDCYTRHQHQ